MSGTNEDEYRKAIEHFKKNPYLKEIMEKIDDLEKEIKENKKKGY